MNAVKDLSNQTFGRLKVIKRVFRKKRIATWECICNCGKIVEVDSGNLRQGNTISCGCFRKENARNLRRKEKGTSGFSITKGRYKRRARDFNLEFTLTDSELLILFKKECFYCGVLPSNRSLDHALTNKDSIINSEFIYNGIDRKNNEIGYTLDNSITCCKNCNFMKRDFSDIVFLEHIKKIYRKHYL